MKSLDELTEVVSRAVAGTQRVVRVIQTVVHYQVRATIHFLQILQSVIVSYFVYVMHMVSWVNQTIRVGMIPNKMGSQDARTGIACYRCGISSSDFTGDGAANIAPTIPLATLPPIAGGAFGPWLSFVPRFAPSPIVPARKPSILAFHGFRRYLCAATALARYLGQTFQPSALLFLIPFISFRPSECHALWILTHMNMWPQRIPLWNL